MPSLTWILNLECPFSFSPLQDPAHLWRANCKREVLCEAGQISLFSVLHHALFRQGYHLTNICWDPLYVPALRYRDEKTKLLPLSSHGNGETDRRYTVLLNICTKCHERKKRNSWVSGGKGRLHLQLRLSVSFKGWIGVCLADKEGGG